jgi:L-fuconolactonase
MTDDGRAVVDAHIHQWDPFTTPRVVSGVAKVVRRAPFLLPALARIFPRSSREFVGDPRYLLNAYLPVDYRADASPAGVGTVVHIEAAWKTKTPIGSVAETHWVGALPFGVDGAPSLGAIVVHADPAKPEIAEVLDAHLRASPMVRGVRCIGAHSDDPGVESWTPSAHLLRRPEFLRGFAAVAERGLSFEIWVYGHQLPDAVVLARDYPQTTFVLDHYASPVGVLGPRGKHTGATGAERKDIVARWRDDLSALAELPNVVAKHSGIGMPILGAGPLPRDELRDAAAPLIDQLDRAFGPDRTFWSSNYPVDKPNIALPDSISILREVLGDRFDEDRMLGGNARRVYRM